ncbi:hypothetical protein N182_01505 [Sinorhizobium sp. GL2]|nr:hypothetical protein N182_01505 [Sinorhizobium sp. GL2]
MTSAPASIRARAASTRFSWVAASSAVAPLASRASMLAPSLSSALTLSGSPVSAAEISWFSSIEAPTV